MHARRAMLPPITDTQVRSIKSSMLADRYARLLAAAKALDPTGYAACCLAGEAGLRIGEIRALGWRRDVDLIAGTITVNRQTRGVVR